MLFEVWWSRFFFQIDDPSSRLSHVSLGASLILVMIWSRSWNVRELAFKWKYWWNKSTVIDYQFYVLNGILKVVLFVPFLDVSFRVSTRVSESLVSLNGELLSLNPSYGALIVFTAGAFVLDDFLAFFQHYWMHRIPLLWKIHSVHHSAKILTPVTQFRTHPIESAISTLRISLSTGLLTGTFIFVFGSSFSIVTVLGVNIFGLIFNLSGSSLRHSHIPISFGRLESWIISPAQHQVHHSKDSNHFGKNLGVSIALWDRLAGTLIRSAETSGAKLNFGLKNRRQKFTTEILVPFTKN